MTTLESDPELRYILRNSSVETEIWMKWKKKFKQITATITKKNGKK